MKKQNDRNHYPDPSNFFDESQDIITLDKPILMLLTKKNEQHHFLFLAERRDRSEIYLLFEIEFRNYLDFLMGYKSLLEIIRKHREPLIVLEKNLDGRVIDQHNRTSKDLNPGFLPPEKSFFNDYPRTKIRYELFGYKHIKDFTHEEYDQMESYDEAFCALNYTYHLTRITHLPEGDKNLHKVLREIAHRDLLAVRERATKLFQEQIKWLEDKYSPSSYEDYNPSRGIGYNFHLTFVGRYGNEHLIVESSMEDYKEPIKEMRKKEEKIFEKYGIQYPTQYNKEE